MLNKDNSEKNITVFVHGYKGTYQTFGKLIHRFEERNKWGSKASIYRISASGEIETLKLFNERGKNLFIQVVFEDNRASIAEYSKWIEIVMKHVNREYRDAPVNIVGHSMGGIAAIKYIQDVAENKDHPEVKKIVTLGSPFDGVYSEDYFKIHKDRAATDLKRESDALRQLRDNKESIPRSIKVLNIGSTGDMIAVPESVKSIKEIVSTDQVKEIMIDRKCLGHSELHEDEEVDKRIHSFLFNE